MGEGRVAVGAKQVWLGYVLWEWWTDRHIDEEEEDTVRARRRVLVGSWTLWYTRYPTLRLYPLDGVQSGFM